MRLSGRQDEAERSAFRVAPGMEFGCETAARSAKRLGLLSPLFMPTAQWCARTTVLSIMSALRSRSTSSASVDIGGRRCSTCRIHQADASIALLWAPSTACLRITPIVLSRAASTPSLSGKKRNDHRPLIVCQTNPFAQGCLQWQP